MGPSYGQQLEEAAVKILINLNNEKESSSKGTSSEHYY